MRPKCNDCWYKFSLFASANAADLRFLDIYTSRVGGLAFDTEIGLYSNTGALLGNDDDDGAGGFSALSFGIASPTRLANGTDLAFDGRDGANVLPAGDYWLAVGFYDVTFGPNNWYAVSYISANGFANVGLGLRR